MDIDDSTGVAGTQIGGQDLHVAGEHDGIDLIVLEQPGQALERPGLIVGRDRHAVKGHAMNFDITAQIFVI